MLGKIVLFLQIYMHRMQLAICYSVKLIIIGYMITPWHKHFTLQDILTFLKEMNTNKGDKLEMTAGC